MAPQRGRGAGGSRRRASTIEDIVRQHGIDAAWDALEHMQNQGIPIDRFSVSRLLRKTVGERTIQANRSQIGRALTLSEAFVEQNPTEADEVLFNAMLDGCCRIRNLARLEACLRQMRAIPIRPSHVTLGILVKAFGQGGNIRRVLQVWEEMATQRAEVNSVTYGCMIDACIRCGHLHKAEEIFEGMKQQGRHRNTIIYTMLIKGYGTERKMRKALELFREMRSEGVPCNTITYNSLIDACVKSGDLDAAKALFQDMGTQEEDTQPDLVTYSTMIKGYCQAGKLDKGLDLVQVAQERGFECDELVYNTLLDGCVKMNDLPAGLGLFVEMLELGMKPSHITHSILVRLHQQGGYKSRSHEAVDHLFRHHGLEPPQTAPRTGRRRGPNGQAAARGARTGEHGSAGPWREEPDEEANRLEDEAAYAVMTAQTHRGALLEA